MPITPQTAGRVDTLLTMTREVMMMPLKKMSRSASKSDRQEAASQNISELTHAKAGDPNWSRKRIIAAALQSAGLSYKAKTKKTKKKPKKK